MVFCFFFSFSATPFFFFLSFFLIFVWLRLRTTGPETLIMDLPAGGGTANDIWFPSFVADHMDASDHLSN